MNRTVVIETPFGRLGNRLQTAAYALAFSEEFNVKVKLLCLRGYEDLINETRTKGLGRIRRWIEYAIYSLIASSGHLRKMLSCTIICSTKENPVILSSGRISGLILSSRISIIRGYYVYTHPSILVRHAERIRKRLALVVEQREFTFISDTRTKENSLIVGVHIRRGDYREYRGGEYFFPISMYENLARSLTINSPGRRFVFLLCSDEHIGDDAFSGMNWIRGPGTTLGDFHALSLCDLVIGPVSTFNRLSAFLGGIPRFEIEKPIASLRISDFRPVEDLTYPTEWRDRPLETMQNQSPQPTAKVAVDFSRQNSDN
jgi:hypothetical protein